LKNRGISLFFPLSPSTLTGGEGKGEDEFK